MKIIDCFIFYNELDLLNYRFSILNEFVDFFILVEASHSFTGKEKKSYYYDNKDFFSEFIDKIIYININDMPFIFPNIDYNRGNQWENEKHQRNCITRGIHKLSNLIKLSDEDIILIADLDEIPDPLILQKIKNNELLEQDCYSLEQDCYYYNLNSKKKNCWHAAKILSYKKYLEIQTDIHKFRGNEYPIIKSGGWHLSYFGDSSFIQNKIQNFSHQELNIPTYTNLDEIDNKIKNNIDLFNRNQNQNIININIIDNLYLPPKYDKYLTKYYEN